MSDVKRYCEFYFDHAQTFVEIADDYGAYVRYDDYAALEAEHAELLAAQDRAALTGAAPGCFVQPVPSHCDRITWRGQYYHLPITTPAAIAAVQEESKCKK